MMLGGNFTFRYGFFWHGRVGPRWVVGFHCCRMILLNKLRFQAEVQFSTNYDVVLRTYKNCKSLWMYLATNCDAEFCIQWLHLS